MLKTTGFSLTQRVMRCIIALSVWRLFNGSLSRQDFLLGVLSIMTKQENFEFLRSICPAKLKNEPYEALLIWLFGSEEHTVAICAMKAYRDVQRNLRGISKMPEQDKKAWREDIEVLISGCIDNLLIQKSSGQEAFDTWHSKTCEEICEVSDKHKVPKWVEWMENGYPYGLAQKILNMTIKNMIIMGRWDDQLDPIRSYLHIPVDSYIMEAAWEDLKVTIPCKNGGVGKYSLTGSKSDTKPWSQWNTSEYVQFQKDVRHAVKGCPMDWEFKAWNKTKAKRESV